MAAPAIEARSLADVRQALARRLEALGRLQGPARGMLQAALQALQGVLDSGGDGTWPPLSPATLREKLRLGFPAQPLLRTGWLRDGWEIEANDGGAGSLRSLAPYAGYLNDGALLPGGAILPARPFVPGTPELLAMAQDAYRDHVRMALEGGA